MNYKDIFFDNYKPIFQDKIRFWRQSKNLTQEELADLLNVAPKTISFWENGKAMPKWKPFMKLCKIMNYIPGGIFAYTTDDEIGEKPESFRLESTPFENYDSLNHYEYLGYQSAKLVYSDDSHISCFINKVGVFELLGSVTHDKEKIVMFTILDNKYTHFITDKIYFLNFKKKLSKDQFHLKTKAYRYIFEINQDIDTLDMKLFLMETHSPRTIRWDIGVAEKSGYKFRLPNSFYYI